MNSIPDSRPPSDSSYERGDAAWLARQVTEGLHLLYRAYRAADRAPNANLVKVIDHRPEPDPQPKPWFERLASRLVPATPPQMRTNLIHCWYAGFGTLGGAAGPTMFYLEVETGQVYTYTFTAGVANQLNDTFLASLTADELLPILTRVTFQRKLMESH